MTGTPQSRFDIHTYESPRNPTSYVDPFAGGTASYFALGEKNRHDGDLHLRPDARPADGERPPPSPSTASCISPPTQTVPENHALPLNDPRQSHPELKLSGRLISASICIRHTVGFDLAHSWDLSPRRGTSALFDHFASLSDPKSSWDHTLVAWTGEIESTGNASKIISLPRRSGAAKAKPSLINPIAGSTALRSSIRRSPGASRGVILSSEDRKKLESRLWNEEPVRTLPVWLYDESEDGNDAIAFTDQSRWRRYAEHELYPDFHYRLNPPTDGSKERKWWADYVRMNRKFADRIMEVYQPGDVVWVHDYQLMLLPAILRQRNAKMYVGFFLHSPFPSSELFRCLKTRRELLSGLLGANLVGFQTYSYARHFSSCCSRILGFDAVPTGVDAYGAHIAVDYHPIGIDVSLVEQQIFGDPQVKEAVDRIRTQYKNMKIIVGRDRLDTGRGVIQKLQAYELFLERYPDWQGKVVLIQLTNSTSIEEGKEDTDSEIIRNISCQISDINDVFGDAEWTPVLHFPQYLSRIEYFALLRAADLAIVTSVRDGMNTTAMEFVVAQKQSHSALILSEFSGTASKLKDATLINPWDLGSVAQEMNSALVRSDTEKSIQHARLYKCLAKDTVSAWSNVYLNTLMVHLASFNKNQLTPPLNKVDLLLQYRKSRKRLLMFDYDGTLTPIVKEPDAAIPSDRVIRTIKKLAQDPRNDVWVISGRDQNFLSEWMAHIPELGLSAEHGSFIRQPMSDQWENLAATIDMSWRDEALRIIGGFSERTHGSYMEKKEISITWHYRRADPELGKYQARECMRMLQETIVRQYDVEVITGKANLEIRPRFVNKGEIARRLVDSYRQNGELSSASGPDFVMACGDDTTDEDMFRTLNECGLPKETVFTCVVGASTKQTLANWHLLEPNNVIAAVSMLNGRPSVSDTAVVEEVEAKLKNATDS